MVNIFYRLLNVVVRAVNFKVITLIDKATVSFITAEQVKTLQHAPLNMCQS